MAPKSRAGAARGAPRRKAGAGSASSAPAGGGGASSAAEGAAGSGGAGTLLEQAAAEEGPPRKRRQLGRRNSEEAVQRALDTKFSHIDVVTLETHKVNGELLRDRITRDRRELQGGARLGSTYWRDLCVEYSGAMDGFQDLRPAQQGESVSDALVQALDICSRTNPALRTTEALEAILRNTPPMNQTEVYGLLKALLANQELGQPAKDALMLEFMHYLVRANQTETWPAMMKVAKPHMDKCLARNFLRLKRSGVRPHVWLSSHLDLCSLLLPVSDLNEVVQAAGEWDKVASQISRLMESSQVGRAVFGFCGDLVNASAYRSTLDKLLADLETKGITEANIVDFKTAALDAADKFKGKNALGIKRVVQVDFAGTQITTEVKDANTEWELRLAAKLKSVAIGKEDGLPVLRHESWILGLGTGRSSPCPVPAPLLKSMLSARKCAKEMLDDPSISCLADVQRIMKSNAAMLVSMDRTFKLELQWVAEGAEKAFGDSIHKAILASLPSATQPTSITQACMKLDTLKTSDEGKMCSLKSQAELKTIRKIVGDMSLGLSPDKKFAAGGEIFGSVWAVLPFFCRAEAKGKGGPLVGNPALDFHMKELATKPTVTMADLDPIVCFKFMMNEAQLTWISNSTKQALNAVGKGGSSLASSSSSDAKASKNMDKKPSVMSFFG